MTAIEQLRHEHEAMTLVLSILDELCQRLANGEEVNPEHFGQVLEFIVVFGDQCHHGKEEQFLFPALEAAGIPKAGGILGVMSEHEQCRVLMRKMLAAWQKHRLGDCAAAAAVIVSARDYSAFLHAHIFQENNVLFPMAEARLSADSQRRLLEEFERLEIECIGAGRHEQFHKTLDFLEQTYLGWGESAQAALDTLSARETVSSFQRALNEATGDFTFAQAAQKKIAEERNFITSEIAKLSSLSR